MCAKQPPASFSPSSLHSELTPSSVLYVWAVDMSADEMHHRKCVRFLQCGTQALESGCYSANYSNSTMDVTSSHTHSNTFLLPHSGRGGMIAILTSLYWVATFCTVKAKHKPSSCDLMEQKKWLKIYGFKSKCLKALQAISVMCVLTDLTEKNKKIKNLF